MTTEPEALRLARELVAEEASAGNVRALVNWMSADEHAVIARALISAEAVVKAAREYRAAEQRLSPIMVVGEAETVVDLADALDGALCNHDAALSPASTHPADVSMDGGNADRSAGEPWLKAELDAAVAEVRAWPDSMKAMRKEETE